MSTYIKKEFHLKNNINTLEKLKEYFHFYNFNVKEISETEIEFYKKGSLFQGWRFNPLNWKSKCVIKITNSKTLNIIYTNQGNLSLSSNGFEFLFENFINNIESYLNTNKDFKISNQEKIKIAKKRIFISFLIGLVGIILGGILGNYIGNLIGIKGLFRYVGMYIGGFGFLKLVNQYFENRKLFTSSSYF
ncbi:hypothetical protein [Polaribacter aestuariivivens]|uniref:hypothetical protein n=1 Tax=Polaribacter aestuariivivens TaxID=2304626 RepID=UPI003F490F35